MTEVLAPGRSAHLAAPSPLAALVADPSLLIHDGRYFLFPTTDGSPDWSATSFSVYSSPDLLDWVDEGKVLQLGVDVQWASRFAWAPAAVAHRGRFLLFFTAEDSIGVAVADTPTGPFTDLGRPLVAPGEFEGRAIDPSVLVDDDALYLYWGNGVAHGVRLADDGLSFDRRQVASFVPDGFREAAMVHRRGDVYYLSWSVDDTRSREYHVRYATGPSPLGPWTDRGVLLQQRPDIGVFATGHHTVLEVDDDDWVIAYHRFAVPSGDGFRREIVFDRLVHTADGLLDAVVPSPVSLARPLRETT